MKLIHIRLFKPFLVLILCFLVLPEAVYLEDIYNDIEICSGSSEGTNSCKEHNCPVVPNLPCQLCPVCCAFSHFFTNQSAGITFHFNNSSQPYPIPEDVLYEKLFAKTLFRPPQSNL